MVTATALDKVALSVAPGLVRQFGKAVRWTRVVEGAYAPATSDVPDVGEQQRWIKALVEALRPSAANTLIEAGDLRLTVVGEDCPQPPGKGDRWLLDNVELVAAYDPVPIYSGELVALWQVQVRR